MLILADGVPRAGWALRDRKHGTIALATVCETEGEVRRLRANAIARNPTVDLEVVVLMISASTVGA